MELAIAEGRWAEAAAMARRADERTDGPAAVYAGTHVYREGVRRDNGGARRSVTFVGWRESRRQRIARKCVVVGRLRQARRGRTLRIVCWTGLPIPGVAGKGRVNPILDMRRGDGPLD